MHEVIYLWPFLNTKIVAVDLTYAINSDYIKVWSRIEVLQTLQYGGQENKFGLRTVMPHN